MKKIYASASILLASLFGTSVPASAQYYEIANQIPQLISPALQGGINYKGFAEVGYVKGVGVNNVDFLSFSTSQGFKYRNWFFMGAGIGVDVAFSGVSEVNSVPSQYNYTTTAVMIPIFTDFRFNIGNSTSTSFFADIKLGCSFLAGNTFLQVNNGYLSSQEYFYFKPSVGVRIPLQSQNKNGKKAFNIGLTYQLLTSNYWYNYNSNVTLNALGLDASFEW